MKYRTRTGQYTSDQVIAKKMSSNAVRAISPRLLFIELLVSIFQLLIGFYAYISRCFLRIRIGERTFGVATLLGVFFFIWATFYFVNVYKVSYQEFSQHQFFQGLGFLNNFFSAYVAMLVAIFGAFIPSFRSLFQVNQIQIPEYSIDLSILAFLVFLLTMGHFIDVYTRRKRNEVIHSYYRGDSFFFEWAVGKKIFGITITKLGVWMIIEPVIVYVMSILIKNYLGLDNIALLLKISAICLFIEEYRVFQDNRRFELDMVDGQLDGAFSAELQKKYAESVEQITKPDKDRKFKATIA